MTIDDLRRLLASSGLPGDTPLSVRIEADARASMRGAVTDAQVVRSIAQAERQPFILEIVAELPAKRPAL